MFQKKVHYVSQLGSMDCGIAYNGNKMYGDG